MKLFVASLTILFCVGLAHSQNGSCVKLTAEETTREGYTATVVSKEKKPFKTLTGKAVFGVNKEPVEDVFVEVFAVVSKDKELKRVAGCRTGADGRFYFADLQKGKYILRFSKAGGYKITEITVKVSPKSKRSEEIIGFVEVGT